MAEVSLVVPVSVVDGWDRSLVLAARQALEGAGYSVEILVVEGPGQSSSESDPGWRHVPAAAPGRVAAAIEGLLRSRGTLLLVLDPASGHAPADVVRLADALAQGRAELVLASRPRGLSWLGRLLTGSADPFSELIGITRPTLEASVGDLGAVGSHFALELLLKVRGRRRDIPVSTVAVGPVTWPGWDDLRHAKRLADHRFGTFSRLVQFCAVGASGMVIDLASYAAFQWLFARTTLAGWSWPVLGKLDLAAAAVLAVLLALTWNFTLNRRLTFNDARRSGSIGKQFLAYALSNALAISLNLFLRLSLPHHFAFFERHKLAAAVVGIILATGLSFSMARWVVFRRGPSVPPARLRRPRTGETLAESSIAT